MKRYKRAVRTSSGDLFRKAQESKVKDGTTRGQNVPRGMLSSCKKGNGKRW